MTKEQIVWMQSEQGLVRAAVRQRHPGQGVRGWFYELTPQTRGVRRTRLAVRLMTDAEGFAFIPAHLLCAGINEVLDGKAYREGRYAFLRDRHGNLGILVSAMGTEGARQCTVLERDLPEVGQKIAAYLGVQGRTTDVRSGGQDPALQQTTNGATNGKVVFAR